jgi:hypothetical protein
MLDMKALIRRPRGKAELAILGVLIIVVVLVVAGLIVHFARRHDSSSAKPKDVTVAFDVSTISLIGPNCSYPTPLGCFIPTDSQAKTLNDINRQGYAMAHIEGKGYSDYETIPGTVPKAPAQKLKALRVTDISSAKGTGQKQE